MFIHISSNLWFDFRTFFFELFPILFFRCSNVDEFEIFTFLRLFLKSILPIQSLSPLVRRLPSLATSSKIKNGD